MKIKIKRQKCFVKDCYEKIPLFKIIDFRLFKIYDSRYNYLLCKHHNEIFQEKYKDKIDYNKKEIRIYKEINVDMDRLKKYFRKNKFKYPALFKK